MRAVAIVAAFCGALALYAAGPVLADAQAGVPLSPADAEGIWTLEASGHGVCQIRLGQHHTTDHAYDAHPARNCSATLPGEVAGWTPTQDGMALVRPDGQTLISFGRWSNSLLVAHRDSGEDLQLQRGPIVNP
jgi:hypothetical protein